MTEKIALLITAMRDKRTPWYAKAIVILALAYIISPIDIIPDFIPVIGLVDEVILIPIAYQCVMRLIPEEIKREVKETTSTHDGLNAIKFIGVVIVTIIWICLISVGYWVLGIGYIRACDSYG